MTNSVPNPLILDLLLEWDDRKTTTPTCTLEEVCLGQEELLSELRQYLQLIQKVESILEVEGKDLTVLPTLPGFEMIRCLGVGGMGAVYLAQDTTLNREVAIKVPQQRLDTHPVIRQRFIREARLLASLKHPNIVPIHSAALHEDRLYFVMQYVPGGSLVDHRERLYHSPQEVVLLLEQIALAIDFAHRQGIFHRDLKPSNILLDQDRSPLVVDFGVAALIEKESERFDPMDTPVETLIPGDVHLTQPGKPVGTLIYSAPECFQTNSNLTARSADIWSLGMIGYELLTGQLPFVNQVDVVTSATPTEPIHPRTIRPDLDPKLSQILLTCLEWKPQDRYPSAGILARKLKQWRRRQVLSQLARRVLLVTGIFLAVVTCLAILLWPASPEAKHQEKLKPITEQLQQGKSVTLIGETGEPISHLVRAGPEYTKTLMNDDGTFAVDAGRPTLVEFLHDPGIESYQISAEVRQDAYFGDAQAGFYFGHQVVPMQARNGHLFGVISFADLGPQAYRPNKPGGPPRSLALFCYIWLVPPGPPLGQFGTCGVVAHEYEAPDHGTRPPGPWRSIQITVNPTIVSGMFDQHRFLDQSHQNSLLWMNHLDRIVRSKELENRSLRPALRGGLGVYLNSCKVSIRNVRIKPIP